MYEKGLTKIFIQLKEKQGFTVCHLPYSDAWCIDVFDWDKLSAHDDMYRGAQLALQDGLAQLALQNLRTVAEKGHSDAAAFLGKVGTELAFYNSYFGGSRIQVANKDSIIRLPVGGLFGPYVDGNNYVLAKMVGIKQWPDSVTVRHILIGTNDPQSGQQVRDDSTGKKLVDSIQTAIKNGADFNALVTKYSDDGGSKEKGGVYDYFPQGQMVIPFNDFAFDNPVGAKGVVDWIGDV